MAEKSIRNLESLIEDGIDPSKPGGFVAQTANGTATWRGTGWNFFPPYEEPSVAPRPDWPAGRNTRTGE